MSERPKIVVFKPPSAWREECIHILEDALADAKAGRVAAVALAYVEPDGSAVTTASKSAQAYALIGAVSVLGYRLQAAISAASNVPRDDDAS